MAGEIQLNSTTMATESSGTITLSNVDNATNRTNLGLGSIATQAADSVSISGGNITGGTIGSGVVFPAGNIVNFGQSYSTTSTQKTPTTSYAAIDTSVQLTNITIGNLIWIIYSFLPDVDGDIRSTIYVDSTTDLTLSGDEALTQTTDAGAGRFLVNTVGTAFFTATSTSHTFTIYIKMPTTGCSVRDDLTKSQIMAMEIQV